MAEKKVRAEVPGLGQVDGYVVNVSESNERWSEITLEDGTVLRTKQVVLNALRLDGRWDPDGNPLYTLKINPVMAIVSAPDHLRKGAVVPKGVN
jgi:hypothetical protein